MPSKPGHDCWCSAFPRALLVPDEGTTGCSVVLPGMPGDESIFVHEGPEVLPDVSLGGAG